eukprot:6491248-Amphidinium_carterae.1
MISKSGGCLRTNDPRHKINRVELSQVTSDEDLVDGRERGRSRIGGILVAVRRTLAEADSISFHEVVAGRVAAVIIQNKLLVLAGHFYAIRGYTWHEVVSSASSFLDSHMHLLQVVAADINVDLCLADRIEVNTGRLHGSITPRTTFFRKHFPDAEWVEFCAGFTYNHLA